MAQPQAPVPPGKPTGTGLFILERDGHRVVVPTPSTYELCIFLCQQNFAKDVPGPHISLYTRELAISPGEPIQITSAAWSRVKGMVNKCEVRLEGDIHERAELGDAGAHSRKRARSRSLSPAPRKRRREDVHSDFVHDNDHSDLESDIARARQRKYWTPRADVELPPAVLTYELLWATKLGPSGQHFCDPHALEPARHFQVQSSRAQLLKDNLKHAVLFYTNFDIKAKGITGPLLTRLIEEQTGMRCAKIKVLEDLATFELRRQKSDTARRLAFVVFESQEQKTRMIAATVYTRGPLLVILREPVAERTALSRFFRIQSPSDGYSADFIRKALHESLDKQKRAIERSETQVERRKGSQPLTFDVMIKLKEGRTKDKIAPPYDELTNVATPQKLVFGRKQHLMLTPLLCDLCSSGGHVFERCPLQKQLGPPDTTARLSAKNQWVPYQEHYYVDMS